MTTVPDFTVAMVTQGRDWIAIAVQAVPPLAAVGVSTVALLFSYQQAKRSLELAARQSRIEEARFRSDVYQRRFDAWKSLDTCAKESFRIMNGISEAEVNAGLASNGKYTLIQYNDAADAIFFLFGDDVMAAVDDLRSALQQLLSASVGMFSVKHDPATESTALKAHIDALSSCEAARLALRNRTRAYMVAEGISRS
jgi:hypothetical protein